tara:strand:- start:568 stop:1902 length:1335 start_codon:yes stop_codon:yes gene_type:complete
MNWKLVKKLVRYELKWKKAYFRRALLSFCIATGLVLILGNESEFTPLVSIIGGALPLSYMLLGHTVVTSMNYSPAVNMTHGFSWKYISVTMTDRHALFVSQILSSIVSAPIFIVYVLVMFALRGYNLYLISLCIPAFLLLLALFRIAFIRQVINFPRTLYARSGRLGVTFITFIKTLLVGTRVFIHYGCLVIIGALVVALSLEVSKEAAIASGSIMLVLFLVQSYRSTMRIWEDERLTHWAESMEWGKSLVYLAVAAGLLVSFKNIKKLDFSDPVPPLIKAIAQNDLSSVRSLIAAGDGFDEVALNRPKKSCSQIVGGTPLIYAIDYSRTQAIQLLLDAGVDVNQSTQNGITPIGFAAMECKLEYLKLLKNYRANMNHQIGNGYPPLFHAVQHNGCLLGVQYLLKNGADPTWKNQEGETYLEFAKRVNPKLYRELDFFMNEIDD